MKSEIQKIINEHLPTQVAGELRKHLEKTEQTETQLAAAKQVLASQEKELEAYHKRAADFDRLAEWQDALDLREKECEERERHITLELAELRIDLMEKNMANMHGLVAKVFGHPHVTISASRQVPYVDQYGNRGTDYTTENETRTEDKE